MTVMEGRHIPPSKRGKGRTGKPLRRGNFRSFSSVYVQMAAGEGDAASFREVAVPEKLRRFDVVAGRWLHKHRVPNVFG
jgi:hypothetical protein